MPTGGGGAVRRVYGVPRMRRPGPASPPAALLALLVGLVTCVAVAVALVSPSALGGEPLRVPGGPASAAGAEPAHGPAHTGGSHAENADPDGPHAESAEPGPLHADNVDPGELQADNAGPGVSAAVVRGLRDAFGERHAPPVSAPGASRRTALDMLRPGRSPVPAAGTPASERPVRRHGVRAPPPFSGT